MCKYALGNGKFWANSSKHRSQSYTVSPHLRLPQPMDITKEYSFRTQNVESEMCERILEYYQCNKDGDNLAFLCAQGSQTHKLVIHKIIKWF